MSLPTAKTEPKTNLLECITLIYGPPKIGKSSFAANFQDAIFLATEEGLNHLSVFKKTIASWKEFKEVCNELVAGKTAGTHNFKTVVVDTIDNLHKMATEAVQDSHKVEHISDIPGFAKGFALLNSEFHRVMTQLSKIGMGLVFISHSKTIEVDERIGKYSKTIPTLPGEARKTILGMADFILYLNSVVGNDGDKAVEKRVIHTKASKYFEAGDRTGRLPEMIPLDYPTFEAEFKKAVGCGVVTPDLDKTTILPPSNAKQPGAKTPAPETNTAK